ncbi:hypothetical protein Esi_0215_0028 [Ectocarpus siliculosus]|uniref:Uncharacterized protein n=1 Tax=Ectocarpus siliculosus TaxID=2880 RepID=D7FRJ5_ECTSI|nr:hypothetical protein Esi_0215_0028 [Ectocarpus siliculosus]|eukprot:CBJ30786.1 hypothetical protein Esi_0215_0028 [Ectocarpus siliculosus]
MQVAVKQALRDWFEAARKGSEGVSGTEVVDAVVTLGLNYDYKQVQRIVFAEARDTNGLLCSVKSFTAALLACCSSDLEKEGLFRLLRGEGDWWGFGLGGVVPARTISAEERKRYDAVLEGIVLAQERNEVHSAASAAGGPIHYTEQKSTSTGQQEQAFPRESQPRLGSGSSTAPVATREKGRPTARCRPRTTSARQGGHFRSAAAVASATGNSSKGHQRRGAPGQTAPSGNGDDFVAWSSSSGRTTMAAARSGQPQQGASAREVIRNTAEGLRDALRKRELHLAKVEARWENYDGVSTWE